MFSFCAAEIVLIVIAVVAEMVAAVDVAVVAVVAGVGLAVTVFVVVDVAVVAVVAAVAVVADVGLAVAVLVVVNVAVVVAAVVVFEAIVAVVTIPHQSCQIAARRVIKTSCSEFGFRIKIKFGGVFDDDWLPPTDFEEHELLRHGQMFFCSTN